VSEIERFQTVTFKVIQGHSYWCHSAGTYDFIFIFHCNYLLSCRVSEFLLCISQNSKRSCDPQYISCGGNRLCVLCNSVAEYHCTVWAHSCIPVLLTFISWGPCTPLCTVYTSSRYVEPLVRRCKAAVDMLSKKTALHKEWLLHNYVLLPHAIICHHADLCGQTFIPYIYQSVAR